MYSAYSSMGVFSEEMLFFISSSGSRYMRWSQLVMQRAHLRTAGARYPTVLHTRVDLSSSRLRASASTFRCNENI